MPKLTINASVTDRGAPTAFPVPVRVTLTLRREDTGFSHIDTREVTTPKGGELSVAFTVQGEVEAAFTTSGAPGTGQGGAAGLISVSITAYAPGAVPFTYTSPVVALFGRGQTFVGIAQTLVDALEVDLSLAGIVHYGFNAVIKNDDATTIDVFDGVDQLTCEVLRADLITVRARKVAAPGKDGAPPDPEVEAAVDAFNDEIASGPDPGQSVEDWAAELEDLRDDIDEAGSPTGTRPDDYTVLASAPALREDDRYTAHLLFRQSDLGGERSFFARFRSAGPDFTGQLVVRGPALPTTWPGTHYALLTRVDRPTGIGTISAAMADRTYRAPFVLMDPDLDIVDGMLRVRGRVGVGFGANLVIASIASLDVSLALTLANHDSTGFSMDELDSFFNIVVTHTTVDMLPGTDLDELPPWVWAALGIGADLSGAALSVAMIAAIELAMKPLVGSMVRSETLSRLATQIRQGVNEEIDTQLATASADFNTTLSDDIEAELRAGAWFEPNDLTVTADAVTVTGFGGVWHTLVAGMNSDCPLNSPSARRSVDQNSARTFQRAVSHPDLGHWLDRYGRSRAELRRLLITKPKLLAKAATFISAHHPTAGAGSSAIIPPGLVTDWLELSAAARQHSSDDLALLLADIDVVMKNASGRSQADARRLATAYERRSPTPHHTPGRPPQARN